MEIKQKWNVWRQLGDVGRGLMANPVAVVGPSFILSSVVINQLGKTYLSNLGGGWYLLALLILSLLGTGVVMWVISPMLGAYYLRRIDADFGPKTRSGVWAWYSPYGKRETDTLNIESLAKEYGEHPIKE